jgi:hypothetical protein
MHSFGRWTGAPIYIRSDIPPFATNYMYNSPASLKGGSVIKDGEHLISRSTCEIQPPMQRLHRTCSIYPASKPAELIITIESEIRVFDLIICYVEVIVPTRGPAKHRCRPQLSPTSSHHVHLSSYQPNFTQLPTWHSDDLPD